MLLGVQTQKAVEGKIKSIAATVKYFSDHNDILIEDLTIKQDHLSFVLLDSDEESKIDKMLSEIKGLKINKSQDLVYTIKLTEVEKKVVKDMAVGQAVETIRNRLDQFGLAEPSVTRQGKTDIVVELPGIKTIEDEQRARQLIAKPANLELMEVDELKSDQVYSLTNEEAASFGDIILEDSSNPNIKYILKQIPILTGSEVVDAKVAFDRQTNQPVINYGILQELNDLLASYKSVKEQLDYEINTLIQEYNLIRTTKLGLDPISTEVNSPDDIDKEGYSVSDLKCLELTE